MRHILGGGSGPKWVEEETCAIVQRLFLLAARRAGSATVLGLRLGLSYAELRPYLIGEMIPSPDVLARTVALLGDDIAAVRSGFSAEAWRALFPPEPQ